MPAIPRPPLEGFRVLVVDDDSDARDMIQTALSLNGAEVAAVGSAAEALIAINGFRPDVLLSDLAMPDEDGFDLIRKVRQAEAGHEKVLPAAAVTALAGEDHRAKVLESGFHAHVAKPVETMDLVDLVVRLLEVREGKMR